MNEGVLDCTFREASGSMKFVDLLVKEFEKQYFSFTMSVMQRFGS